MDRLKDDIDERARNFEYIEYYDASLRDRMAKDLVSAGDNQSQLDERRRPLASINPLYAQASVLPPSPSVDDSVNEQLALNVAKYAATTLEDINYESQMEQGTPVEPSDIQTNQDEQANSLDAGDELSGNNKDEQPTDSNKESQTDESPSDELKEEITNEVEEKATFELVLISAGNDKLKVVKALKDTFGIALEDAKNFVDAVPTTLIKELPKEEAEELKRVIESAGATLEIRNSQGLN